MAHLGGDELGVLLPSADLASAERTVLDLLHALEVAGVTKIFTDAGVSGTLATRTQFDAALAYLRDGDTLVVWKLDRSAARPGMCWRCWTG